VNIEFSTSLKKSFSALEVFEQLIKTSPENSKPEIKELQLKTLENIGFVYCLQSNYPKSIEYDLKALKIAEELDNKNQIVSLNSNIGTNYKEQGDYPKALDQFFKAMKIADGMNSKVQLLLPLMYIGGVYVLTNDNPRALEYYLRALKIAEDSVKENVVPITFNIANVYHKQKESAKALEYCNKALSMDKRYLNKYYYAGAFILMGEIYAEGNKRQEALEYYLKALKLTEETGDKKGQTNALNSIGKIYTSIKKYRNADHYLQKALMICDSIGIVKLKLEVEQNLSTLYEQTGNDKKALDHYKKAMIAKDSLFNQEKEREMTRKSMNYEFDKKETTAKAEQEKKDALSKTEIQQQKIIRNSFIAGSILLLVLIVVLINRNKLKRSMEMEKMRSRLSRDLHDDIGSTLSSINILSRTAQNSLHQTVDEKTKSSLEKINERSQRLLDSMSDIIWNINPGNDTIEEVMSRMREYATTILEAKNIDYTFNFPKEKLDCTLTMEVKNNMYLIFKEAVNNLSKYSGATHATLSLTFDEKNIHLIVEDNGKGFIDSEIKHRGGLSNMQLRAEEIRGTMNIQTVAKKGTIIKLTMPRYC
jgi:signal transduction histidine kinase